MNHPNVTRETLFEILSFARPHDGKMEERFLKEFIDKAHPDMTRDAYGNRILRLGSAPIMWSCHVDNVGTYDGIQVVNFEPDTGIACLFNGKAGQSLGADNGAGVWMLLAMIDAGMEGLYVFHRGEEKGCLGSNWIVRNTPDLVKGIDVAIAFDRAGTKDIITHQSFGMTSSDAFAQALADQLNPHGFAFRPDDTGIYTDTNEYADLVAECTNVSVGYECNHGPRETLDVYHVENLLKAVLSLDLDAMTPHRQPGEGGWQSYMGSSFGSSMAGSPLDRTMNAKVADLLEAISHCPEAAARLLYHAGYVADEVWDEAFTELDDDPYDTDSDLDRAILHDDDGASDVCPFATADEQ